MKRFSICIAAFSLFTVWGLHIPATHAGTMDLITTLVSSLGITKDQAMGGTGALFQNAEENLIGQDFQKVSDAVPGMDRYLAAAPARA
ncbi:MAG TPA: hypothetical protein ENH37_13365, partial [Deltaproteobacteria bacterium]|nr:hypothetical protein [Deltaproteobacteria bacterium]